MSLEKIKRHLGKPVKFKLKNQEGQEDEFEIKPLTMEQYSIFFFLSSKFREGVELDKESAKEFIELIYDLVSSSYPDIEKNILKQFVATNFVQIIEQLPKLMPGTITEEEKKLLQKRLKGAK